MSLKWKEGLNQRISAAAEQAFETIDAASCYRANLYYTQATDTEWGELYIVPVELEAAEGLQLATAEELNASQTKDQMRMRIQDCCARLPLIPSNL